MHQSLQMYPSQNKAKIKGKEVIDETMMAGSSSGVDKTKELNPFAKEWDPIAERATEERRCLYLAFPSCNPLDEVEITLFFLQ